MQLSTNFSLRELAKSQEALRRGIDNSPDAAEIENLRQLAQNILQPVRDHFGKPFSPSSGFRCLELNRAIGSSDRSQHVRGQAADFEVPGIGNDELAAWVRDNLAFDQLILEFYQAGEPSSGWVHCSYVVADRRAEALTFDGGRYSQGLIA